MAEVGVLIGQLSEYLLSRRPGLKLIMVDSWLEKAKQPEHYKATGDAHALHDAARCSQHRKEAENRARHFPGRADVIALPSVEAAALVGERSLDLVFLDADHSMEGVTADLAAWAPKVKPGGWIGGHDYANPDPAFHFEVKRAVDEWAGDDIETDLNFTWWRRL